MSSSVTDVSSVVQREGTAEVAFQKRVNERFSRVHFSDFDQFIFALKVIFSLGIWYCCFDKSNANLKVALLNENTLGATNAIKAGANQDIIDVDFIATLAQRGLCKSIAFLFAQNKYQELKNLFDIVKLREYSQPYQDTRVSKIFDQMVKIFAARDDLSVDFINSNGLLFYAVRQQDESLVIRLLKKGANPNAKDKVIERLHGHPNASLPLFIAQRLENKNIVANLIKGGGTPPEPIPYRPYRPPAPSLPRGPKADWNDRHDMHDLNQFEIPSTAPVVPTVMKQDDFYSEGRNGFERRLFSGFSST